MKSKDITKLMWATALVAMIRYMGSFVASDQGLITGWLSDLFTVLLALAGIAMGFLDSVGTAFLFNGWRKVMPPNGVKWNLKFKMITFFVFSLFISSMTILVPFTLSRIEQVSISVILGGKGSIGEWSWGIMVNAIPFLIIGGVSLGNKWIEDLESGNFQESSRNNSNIREEKKEKSADWRKLRPTLSHEDLMNLAKLTPDAIRQYAAQTGFTYKTISNWRISARKELGMSEDMERLQ